MIIEKLSLQNFKNYEDAEFHFSHQINFITGKNGSGKTNLLDALHYISLSKSAFGTVDSLSMKHGSSYFLVKCLISNKEEKFEILCSMGNGHKKSIKVNKKPYSKISEHIGRFPLVLITPYDTDYIREGSEERRKFVDSILSQLNPLYLLDLIQYNEALKQRNSLLKQLSKKIKCDKDLISFYDKTLINLSKKIYKERNLFIKEFTPIFNQHYDSLSDSKEKPGIIYKSHASEEKFEDNFFAAFKRDQLLERTSIGIHKDDFLFMLDGYPLKNFGSQGQQKSFVIALKLSQYDLIKQKKCFKPILLLDDIFDKLDNKRIKQLMEMIAREEFGQVFITDAREERIYNFIDTSIVKVAIFSIENGKAIHEKETI